MVGGSEDIIVSLYAKGMTVSDMEDQLYELYGFQISTSTISRITDRIACRFVSYKYRKDFTTDMRLIYIAPNEKAALSALDELEKKWNDKYAYAIRSWRNNWTGLTALLQFPIEIRRIIYTTNTIENLNGKIRKYTRNKLSFPTDEAVQKPVYLAIMEATKDWNRPIANWRQIPNQFIIIFENRPKPD